MAGDPDIFHLTRAIKDLNQNLVALTKELKQNREPQPTVVNHLCETLHYDDNTLFKVRGAIDKVLADQTGLELPRTASSIISELQNAGILFRERS